MFSISDPALARADETVLTAATVERIEELLVASDANLVYAGYPYDPFAPDAPKN